MASPGQLSFARAASKKIDSEVYMLLYECDNGQKLKEKSNECILGVEAENIGVKAARREITFFSQWNEDEAVDWLAVHFCSERCKQDYTSRLFGDTPASGVVSETAVVPLKKRGMRLVPADMPAAKARNRRRATRHKSIAKRPKSA